MENGESRSPFLKEAGRSFMNRRLFIGLDLGSTNIKAGIYDAATFQCLADASVPVPYDRSFGVEIDLGQLETLLLKLLRDVASAEKIVPKQIEGIGLTGQAETLVILDKAGKPLMNAISWMDERSKEECAVLERQFTAEVCEQATGQKAILPTWPATKILWLRKNRPDIFEKAAYYMLLKDYIVYRLTGKMSADCSIATFSFYFDIYKKCYWKEMLDAIGIREEQLPELTEPCTEAGNLAREIAEAIGIPKTTKVNLGTLDHFAGMIGTGNIEPGIVSLSTGTVMALATLARRPKRGENYGIAMHYGFWPDTYVMLPVAESGGVSLEWFRRTCMQEMDYESLNWELEQRTADSGILFLPYLVGTNAPEFDAQAKGIFYGLRAEHDAVDMAKAVMEGVAFVLKKNCESIQKAGMPIRQIFATGGGTRSRIWCQIQADITGIPIVVLKEKEIGCLGAAVLAAVAAGACASYEEAAKNVHKNSVSYIPKKSKKTAEKYRKFGILYRTMMELES